MAQPETPAMTGLRLHEQGPASFLHNVGESYDDLAAVTGVARYSGRVLCATLAEDTIHLAPELQEELPVIRSHYEEIGLSTAENVVWDMSLGSLSPKNTPSVFLYDERVHQVTPNLRRLDAVNRYNNKNWFIDLAQAEDQPTPQTNTYGQGEEPKQNFEGPWFVKDAVAASGTRVVKCDNWEEVQATARTFNAFQVQQGVNAVDFLNVQYSGTPDGTAEFVATTGQVLDGFAHAGNRHPSKFDPRSITDKAAQRAAQEGILGTFAFDVAVEPDTTELYKLIECNPRPNGATYPTALSERLNVSEWSCLNTKTMYGLAKSIKRLEAEGLIYSAQEKLGAVVVNWGTARDGKLGIFYAGPEKVQQEYAEAARQILTQ